MLIFLKISFCTMFFASLHEVELPPIKLVLLGPIFIGKKIAYKSTCIKQNFLQFYFDRYSSVNPVNMEILFKVKIPFFLQQHMLRLYIHDNVYSNFVQFKPLSHFYFINSLTPLQLFITCNLFCIADSHIRPAVICHKVSVNYVSARFFFFFFSEQLTWYSICIFNQKSVV